MTTIKSDTTSFPGLPKNRTGLFAADTIHEVKTTKNRFLTIPPLSAQFRHNGSTNLLLASSEQNHHQIQQYQLSKAEIQQYYPIDQSNCLVIDSSNDSRSTTNGIRNGFRPSTVRHQKLRLSTASKQRILNPYENQDLASKSPLIQSQTAAKLKLEIEHINEKFIKPDKSLRLLNTRELVETPASPLSYANTHRDSSMAADRIHKRFSSAITHNTSHTRDTIQTNNNNNTNDISDETVQVNNKQEEPIDYQITHAYQIPQQSNVGSDSVFLIDPPLISSIKTRSAHSSRHGRRISKDSKSISCPFYVMYFTNLAIQQHQQNQDETFPSSNKENARLTTGKLSTIRKVPVNSRTSTANLRNQRPVHTPVSIKTYSTIDDSDERLTNSTSAHLNNKRSSRKISSNTNGNSPLLDDILRTSSWNHVQV